MDNPSIERLTQQESPKLSIARITTWLLYGGLILGYSVWQLTRADGPSYFFWCVQVLPLLLVFPGMKIGNPRSYIWLCFLLLAYFIKGFDGVISPSRAWIDYLVLTISILLFISAMLTSRWRQQYLLQPME
jgi:uncharacterized membrane protein